MKTPLIQPWHVLVMGAGLTLLATSLTSGPRPKQYQVGIPRVYHIAPHGHYSVRDTYGWVVEDEDGVVVDGSSKNRICAPDTTCFGDGLCTGAITNVKCFDTEER